MIMGQSFVFNNEVIQIVIQDVENKYKAEFFEDLISIDERRKKRAIEQAQIYRLQKDSHYSIMTVRINEEKSEIWRSDGLDKIKAEMAYLINLRSQTDDWNCLITSKGTCINILIMWGDVESYETDIRQIAKSIEQFLNPKLGTVDYRIGIGRAFWGLDKVWHSLRDAERALEATGALAEERIVEFDTLGIYKIFCQDNLKGELFRFFSYYLKKLVDYDRKTNTELVKSLEVYFEVNGNIKKMSEILFIHYNTTLYRINRIQEITGMRLANEHDRYGLQTALKIMNILELEVRK